MTAVADRLVKQRASFHLQAAGSGDAMSVEGYGITWGLVNDYDRVFLPGAFAQSIEKLAAAGRSLTMGFEHAPFAPFQPIGKWPTLREDDKGFFMSGRISDTTLGRDAWTLAKDDAVTGISIGFCLEEDDYYIACPNEPFTFAGKVYRNDCWTTYVFNCDLREASLVAVPADDGARITSVQTAMSAANRALPALKQDATWEDAAYSMALLMGGRGSAAFADLPQLEHRALFQRVAAVYTQHGKTAPAYDRAPNYSTVEFHHDEREVFHDRYLQKSLASVIAGAAGVRGALSEDTRAEAVRAIQALQPLTQSAGAPDLASQLRELNELAQANPLIGGTQP